MEKETKNKAESIDSSTEKLLLSDVSIGKIIELFRETMSEKLHSVEWKEESNYGIYDALNDSLDEIEKRLKGI